VGREILEEVLSRRGREKGKGNLETRHLQGN
jgi:hypothetical protein